MVNYLCVGCQKPFREDNITLIRENNCLTPYCVFCLKVIKGK